MHKTTTRLADGRELIYFDESAGPDSPGTRARESVDQRNLPARAGGSELRYDPILAEWVAIASHRQGRTFLPPTDECPLCPSRPGRLTEIPAESYDVAVFENRFPSFATDADSGAAHVQAHADAGGAPDLFARRPGVGRCEVVCFTSDHNTSFAGLSPARVRTVIEAWVDRTLALNALDGVEQVFCFENRGVEIGVTLHHPHGQIYAYPFVTPRTQRMLTSAEAYAARTSRNLFEDVVRAERDAKVRVVAETDHWTAFVPAAARWPIEVHIYPHRRVPDLPALTEAERADFAQLYLRLLRAADARFDMPLPYVSAWHQAPTRVGREHAALHLELFSIRRDVNKLKYVAGSESAMGVWINDVPPEDIAARLRELL